MRRAAWACCLLATARAMTYNVVALGGIENALRAIAAAGGGVL